MFKYLKSLFAKKPDKRVEKVYLDPLTRTYFAKRRKLFAEPLPIPQPRREQDDSSGLLTGIAIGSMLSRSEMSDAIPTLSIEPFTAGGGEFGGGGASDSWSSSDDSSSSSSSSDSGSLSDY